MGCGGIAIRRAFRMAGFSRFLRFLVGIYLNRID
jgi:hypothetical protein